MAIPKKIHWCWLSGDPLPDRIQDCVDSWKRLMPDYEFVLWDMNRFDIHSVKFVEDACAARKWAFAADYIRLHALYTEGGIYLDSDVFVYRRLDKFLNYPAFSGVVTLPANIRLSDSSILNLKWYLEAEIIGAEKHHPFIKTCKEYYETKAKFEINSDGKVMFETMPDVITRIAYEQFGLNLNASIRKVQKIKSDVFIFPPTVFEVIFWSMSMRTYAAHLALGNGWRNVHKNRKPSLHTFYRRFRVKHRSISILRIWRKKLASKLQGRSYP